MDNVRKFVVLDPYAAPGKAMNPGICSTLVFGDDPVVVAEEYCGIGGLAVVACHGTVTLVCSEDGAVCIYVVEQESKIEREEAVELLSDMAGGSTHDMARALYLRRQTQGLVSEFRSGLW